MSALADLHLLRPGWLLIAVPALWLIWRNKQSQAAGSQWARACDPALLDAMLQQPGQTSRWPMWLASAAALIGAIALAGPTWQRLPTPVLQSEAATVIVLDLSKSMDATDLEPSRLSRARFAALDVLAALPEGRVGVVSFAGSAFTVVPLTDDRETAKHLITSLDTDVMPIQGSRIGTGLGKAHDLLRNAAASNGRVVLLTDSAPDRAALRQAETLRDTGHSLQVVGFGTAAGAPVPAADGGWIKRDDGSIVLAGLDEAALRQLAARGGGQYRNLPAAGLLATAQQWQAPDQNNRSSRDDLTTDRWLDAGQWLVWLLLPLCALTARRGWLAQIALVLGCLGASGMPSPSYAADSSLWRNADQQGKALLEDGKATEAQQKFATPAWRGVAAFEAGDYAAAAEAFEQSEQADASYNRGNALARAGELQAALEAYDAQLAERPDHADAQYNRELIQALLDQQQQQQQQGDGGDNSDSNQQSEQQGDQSQSQQSQGDEQSQDGQQQQAQNGADPQQDQASDTSQEGGEQSEQADNEAQQQAQAEADQRERDAQDAEQRAAQAQTMSEDERAEQQQQQALEQWLRRVPDDPGGLLRRKFAREQARRDDTRDSEQNW